MKGLPKIAVRWPLGRWERAPWTEEDKEVIRFRVTHAARHGYNFYDKLFACMNSDIYDADLMFKCQNARKTCDRFGLTHCLIAYDRLAVNGFDDPERGLFEQGLALLLPKLPGRYR